MEKELDSLLDDIPKPPKEEKKETKEEKILAIETQIKRKISKWYFIGGVSLFLIILVTIIMFLTKVRIIITIIWLVISIPLLLGSTIIILIRLYLDKNKLSDFLLLKISKNLIRVNIKTKRRKVIRKYFRAVGKEFEWGGGLYLLDLKAVWMDEDNIPNLDYYEGIPNPLLYNFEKQLSKYTMSNNKSKFKDNFGNSIDVSYSSETLKLFKKDKLFTELHRAGNEGIIQMFLIFMVAVCVILLLVMMFRK